MTRKLAMEKYETSQEQFWAGNFGDEYINRNMGGKLLASNSALFAKILSNTTNIKSVIEFGANIGLNLIAIKKLLPEVEISAIEINKKAVEELHLIPGAKVYNGSILNFACDYRRDFVFTKGVLIHVNPEKLSNVINSLYESSRKYICIAEYYNPSPVSIPYRGHQDKLFKRDFAGELLEKFKDLRLVDYGFVYHRDNTFPLDDLTWFLMEKKAS